MQQTPATARIAAFFASVAISALMVASQFSLARHYADAGGLLWAGQVIQAPVAQATPAHRAV
jgi:hypothetical protein